MISTNTSLLILIKHDQSRVCNCNICSTQELICLDKPSGTKFKRVCMYLPNLTIFTKSVTLGEFQVTYSHTSIGNKYLREIVADFPLLVYLEGLTVVLIDAKRNFYKKNIHPLIMEVLLRATVSDLSRSKKLRDWMVLNTVFVKTFLAEAVVLKGKAQDLELMKTFDAKIL